MSKIYDLYSPDQRKIDNLKRRIRGYQKMEKDLINQNRKVNNKNRELQQRINKAVEYIKNNTMYFDSEYAKDFGELCPIAGAGDTRIHCVIGDKELLKILKGDSDE